MFAGTDNRVASVTFTAPLPVPAAALKTFAAAGAVVPAGTVTGYASAFVGSEQFPLAALDDAEVIVDDAVGSVFPPALVKVVDVTWMFQPEPDDVLSVAVSATELVDCRSLPLRVTAGIVNEDGDVRVSDPPAQGGLNVATVAAHAPDFVLDCNSLPAAPPGGPIR